MKEKECPSCKKKQPWDEIYGFNNQICPEYCNIFFYEFWPLNFENLENFEEKEFLENQENMEKGQGGLKL